MSDTWRISTIKRTYMQIGKIVVCLQDIAAIDCELDAEGRHSDLAIYLISGTVADVEYATVAERDDAYEALWARMCKEGD